MVEYYQYLWRGKIMLNNIRTDYLYMLVNSYLLYIIWLIFAKGQAAQIVEIQNGSSFGMLIGFLLVGTMSQLGYQQLKPNLQWNEIFYILFGLVLIILSWTQSYVALQIGYLLLSLPLIGYLQLNKHRWVKYSLVVFATVVIRLLMIYLLSGEGSAPEFQWGDGGRAQFLLIISCIAFFTANILAMIRLRDRTLAILVGVILTLLYVAVMIILVAKPLTISSPNFDMGIFTQVYESIIQGRGAATSLERDILQSHFAVHISPILYLLTPIYYLFPSPVTLVVLQILITFSAVIPFYLILKEFQLNRVWISLLILMLGVMPPLITGHFYDFHENSFLAPLVLWLFYAHLRGNQWGIYTSALLVLLVKEDAFIYVFAIGLYFLFQRRVRTLPPIKLILSHVVIPIIYFSACIYYLNQFGDGAMTSRFDNFMIGEGDGLLGIAVNALTNPLYTIHTLFRPAKVIYLLTIFLSSGLLAFYQREWANYLLLIPMVVINLLSNYLYQVDITKQYHYGSAVLVLILVVLAVREIQAEEIAERNYIGRVLLIMGALVGLTTTIQHLSGRAYYVSNWIQNHEEYREIHQTLAQVPRGEPILAFTFYTPHLADNAHLYDLFYHNNRAFNPEIHYVVFPDNLINSGKLEEEIVQKYYNEGYQELPESTEQVIILGR